MRSRALISALGLSNTASAREKPRFGHIIVNFINFNRYQFARDMYDHENSCGYEGRFKKRTEQKHFKNYLETQEKLIRNYYETI